MRFIYILAAYLLIAAGMWDDHWSNRPQYRLMDPGANNFFRVKANVLRNMK